MTAKLPIFQEYNFRKLKYLKKGGILKCYGLEKARKVLL
jgi:hypothetical protein